MPKRLLLLFSLSMAPLLGCSGGDVGEVTGTITHNGKPVTAGDVVFYPIGKGRPAFGSLESDGSYSLQGATDSNGVPVGRYRVTVSTVYDSAANNQSKPATMLEELTMADVPKNAPKPKPLYPVPQKYSNAKESGLTATVESGDNQIDFVLEDQ